MHPNKRETNSFIRLHSFRCKSKTRESIQQTPFSAVVHSCNVCSVWFVVTRSTSVFVAKKKKKTKSCSCCSYSTTENNKTQLFCKRHSQHTHTNSTHCSQQTSVQSEN